ncbi:hypothetical protein [Paracoccus sp. PARArs4]|uniref:AbiU2 domain-containing protein n=1 Tax=Paracoccus sp. PARArs4 TaxID=2853442 RepID=UPI0024A64D59|nr:hypothetical protein [Paracoccus sp. PARArs4]
MDRPWEHLDRLAGRDAASAVAGYCHLQLVHLKHQERIYSGLFGDQQRVEVMNAASGPVAKVMQDALFDMIVLGICRLLDPAGPARKPVRNLTFALLIDLLPMPDRQDEYHAELKKLRADAASLLDRRNKHIAHADSAAVEEGAEVGWVSVRQIKTALDDMHDLLRRICVNELGEQLSGWEPNDHHELQFLRALAFGNAAREQKLIAWEKAAMAALPEDLPDPEDIYPEWLRSPLG